MDEYGKMHDLFTNTIWLVNLYLNSELQDPETFKAAQTYVYDMMNISSQKEIDYVVGYVQCQYKNIVGVQQLLYHLLNRSDLKEVL